MRRTKQLIYLFLVAFACNKLLHGASLRGIMTQPSRLTLAHLKALKGEGITTILLSADKGRDATEAAAEQVLTMGLQLYYWIDIARNESLAKTHPEWMASIQTHQEWRRHYPQFPTLASNEVTKAFPWLPIGYKETFPLHFDRVSKILNDLPKPTGVFLNQLQGPPSVCGCGHTLCRWTTDYGPLRTATLIGDGAAARFVQAVQSRFSGMEIIPVWASECEEEDQHTFCGGVGCFRGACWREWTKQFEALKLVSETIATLGFYKQYERVHVGEQRDQPAQWIGHAVDLMTSLPTRYGKSGFEPENGIAVLQGWNVSAEELRTQKEEAEQAGLKGWIVAEYPIDESWKPYRYKLVKTAKNSQ